MKEFIYDDIGETVFWGELANGLTVAVVPRKGFSKKYAYFVTDFGSIHTAFSLDGKDCLVPAGVAHYLEHKLFDMPGRDISGEFAALGANVNAFTSYDMTAYYFSCTEHFEECLALLLEFVSTPYFTEETVAKEQGIIGQEIDMTADTPDNRVFENLMADMYREHPISVPILGTRQTIERITPQVLHCCHRAFYRPDNMMLCVVGDVDAGEIAAMAEKLPKGEGRVSRQGDWPESMVCDTKVRHQEMEVAMPMFQIGFKAEPLGRGAEAVRQEIIGDLAAEALFGESSQLYLRLYKQGLIDSSFGGGLETVEGMAMLTVSGDSDDPEGVRDAILEQAALLARTGISDEEFGRMKRSAMGRRVRELDSFDSVCFRLCAYHFSGFDYFRFPALYRQVEKEDLQTFLRRVVTKQRCAMSVIEPKEAIQ